LKGTNFLEVGTNLFIFSFFHIKILARFNKKLAQFAEFTLIKQKIPNFFIEKWQIACRRKQHWLLNIIKA
jgi:hypothetical protein